MSALDARGQEICTIANGAFGKRGSLLNFWQETAENFYPERADFTVQRSWGEEMTSRLYASDPVIARRDFANYLGAALRPKGRVWFKPKARDEELEVNSDVSSYLDKRGLGMYNRLKDWRSRFAQVMTAADHDYCTFGNSVVSVDERADRQSLRFRHWHIRDCAWMENYEGEVDTLFRKAKVSVKNLVSRQSSGWTIHQKVMEKMAKNPADEANIMHCMMPAEFYDPGKKTDKPFVSMYVDVDNNWLMAEKPVPTFNYVVSRWFTIDSSPYAFSPAVICSMPDARSLQTMTWSIVEAGEKAVEPPMVAVEEVVQGGVDLRAGAVTWIDKRYDERTGEAVRAIDIGGTPQFGEVLREGLKGNLRDAWYLSRLFLPEAGPQMTAQEVQRRHEEWLRVAQPIIEPAEPERSGMVLDVVTQLEFAMGLWGKPEDMPAALRGRMVDFTYDNPLEDARKMAATNAFRSLNETAAAAAQIYGPKVLANIDTNKAFREAILGVAPPDWLVSEDKAQAAMDKAEQADMMDKAAQQAAALAQTNANVDLATAKARAA